MILINKQNIMECDKSEIPELMSSLSVENSKQIHLLLQIADDIY